MPEKVAARGAHSGADYETMRLCEVSPDNTLSGTGKDVEVWIKDIMHFPNVCP
jgi:hypothetical protein